MRRDRLTFGMMIGIPLLELDAVRLRHQFRSETPAGGRAPGRQRTAGPDAALRLRNSGYFDFVRQVQSEAEGARRPRARRSAVRRQHPAAFHARPAARRPPGRPPRSGRHRSRRPPATRSARWRRCSTARCRTTSRGRSPSSPATNGPIDLRVHALYNPEAITQYNIVPGLLGVVLTMTMVLITALAITRERERGTMENLLSMPTRPAEVLAGKIIPYIFVGYIQVS